MVEASGRLCVLPRGRGFTDPRRCRATPLAGAHAVAVDVEPLGVDVEPLGAPHGHSW